jgi:hypothetical protein
MNGDVEPFLERLSPRGAPEPLRQRVLDGVTRELAARPRPRRWSWAAALAVCFLLAVGLNVTLDRAHQARLAALYGPEPVPQPLSDVTRAVEQAADARTADWFRNELRARVRRPARDDTWTEYYSRTLREEWLHGDPLESHEIRRNRRRGGGGALFDRQRLPDLLHGSAA